MKIRTDISFFLDKASVHALLLPLLTFYDQLYTNNRSPITVAAYLDILCYISHILFIYYYKLLPRWGKINEDPLREHAGILIGKITKDWARITRYYPFRSKSSDCASNLFICAAARLQVLTELLRRTFQTENDATFPDDWIAPILGHLLEGGEAALDFGLLYMDDLIQTLPLPALFLKPDTIIALLPRIKWPETEALTIRLCTSFLTSQSLYDGIPRTNAKHWYQTYRQISDHMNMNNPETYNAFFELQGIFVAYSFRCKDLESTDTLQSWVRTLKAAGDERSVSYLHMRRSCTANVDNRTLQPD
jgi:hypothetical protein